MCKAITIVVLFCVSILTTAHEKECFDFDWKFILNSDDAANSKTDFNDDGWSTVQLPHDWSISQQFDSNLSGCNGHLPGGIGWYRKSFIIDKKDRGKHIEILFDGIYSRSDVYINGHHLGFRPYGFCYIQYDITPYLNIDGNNVIAVRVNDPSDDNHIARWYTGSGIYRHAWLIKTDDVYVENFGTYVTTPQISDAQAEVRVTATICNSSEANRKIRVVQQVLNADRKPVGAGGTQTHSIGGSTKIQSSQTLTISNPKRWDIDTPYLYILRTSVYEGKKLVDTYETPFGVRTAEFTSGNGFLLNGRRVKLHGFCLHQDEASLGSALPFRAMQRKLEVLKEYGVNAIRCSHNQPAPEFLDLCDSMGFVVIDEGFDKWKSGYYAEYFDEWWQQDLSNMIVRDRNHPCVILWSIGNELQEAWNTDDTGVERARMLQDFVHRLEPTRQVCLSAQNNHQTKFAGVTDVIGYNYLEARMLSDHKRFPERRMLVTEELPYYCGAEGNIRAYDTNNPWNIVAANDFIAGGFIWSGVDYIGEAGWPSHGWPNGLFDICLVEKPRAMFLRTLWNDTPVVGIAVRDNALNIDHGRDLWQWPPMAAIWNFPSGYQGLVFEVNTITNCEKVMLSINGKMMGVKRTDDYANHTIVWNVPYTPGVITAKGINGTDTVAEYTIYTAGEPERLKATADRTELAADGQDLSFIQLELLDKDGHLVQHINRHISAAIEGEGRLVGLINSDLRRTTPFTSHEDDTYFGRAMAIVQTTRKAGQITLTLNVEGLPEPVVVRLSGR